MVKIALLASSGHASGVGSTSEQCCSFPVSACPTSTQRFLGLLRVVQGLLLPLAQTLPALPVLYQLLNSVGKVRQRNLDAANLGLSRGGPRQEPKGGWGARRRAIPGISASPVRPPWPAVNSSCSRHVALPELIERPTKYTNKSLPSKQSDCQFLWCVLTPRRETIHKPSRLIPTGKASYLKFHSNRNLHHLIFSSRKHRKWALCRGLGSGQMCYIARQGFLGHHRPK